MWSWWISIYYIHNSTLHQFSLLVLKAGFYFRKGNLIGTLKNEFLRLFSWNLVLGAATLWHDKQFRFLFWTNILQKEFAYIDEGSKVLSLFPHVEKKKVTPSCNAHLQWDGIFARMDSDYGLGFIVEHRFYNHLATSQSLSLPCLCLFLVILQDTGFGGSILRLWRTFHAPHGLGSLII